MECGDGVVDESQIGLLFGGEVGGVINDGEVNVGIREGELGLFGEGFELFYGGLAYILVSVVQSN